MNYESTKSLRPLVERVRTSTCCVKRPGEAPSRLKTPDGKSIPLSEAKLAKHMNGGPAYGVYPMEPDTSTTRVALLDLDSHKGEIAWSDMQAVALRIMAESEAVDLRGNAFRSSGGAGIHIYYLWDTPQDAHSVRKALRSVLASVGLSDGAKGVAKAEVEVFPKQDRVEADEFGNMFVLPLAGKSLPLDSFELEDMGRYADIDWTISKNVPVIVREVEEITRNEPSVPLNVLASALDAIPNAGEIDYDAWRNLVFAIHYETNGSDEGYALALKLSARSVEHDEKFFRERVWPYVKSDRSGKVVTGRTVLAEARKHGWTEDVSDQFGVVDARVELDWPDMKRDKKGIFPTIGNILAGLRAAHFSGVRLGFDEFRAEVMIAVYPSFEWRSFGDEDYTHLLEVFEGRGFKPITRDNMRNSVWKVAHENRFDSAKTWLESLKWDGVARVESFLTDYMSVMPDKYSSAVSRYIWSALAGRVMFPGCEAPMVPVFIGGQGAGKTRSVKAIAPAAQFYTELNLADRDAEASRRMRGRLVIELGELRGLHTRDADSIKAFISRTDEEWRTLYKEFNNTFARRFIFFGTTNQGEFLADETGERRWLPIDVGKCDPEGIAKVCLQLWAEGADIVRREGVKWLEAEKLGKLEHRAHKITDVWEATIARWLNEESDDFSGLRMDGVVTCAEVLTSALKFETKHVGLREEMRVAKILKGMGFEKVTVRFKDTGRKQFKAWRLVTGQSGNLE